MDPTQNGVPPQSNVTQVFAGLSDSEVEVLSQADRFARAELYPLARRMDDEEWWPDGLFELFGRNGYLGITATPELGGSGADIFTSGLVLQAFSRWNHAAAMSWLAHENLCLHNLLRNASQAQIDRYGPALCSGKAVGALGMTEPGAGSDAMGSMHTTAQRDGDRYRLNGTKLYITNGPIANVMLVYARTDRERGSHGISAFIVEPDFPGFRVAQKLTKMGFRGSPTGELVFEDCLVPVANRVGEENAGVKILMSGLDIERAMVSPMCLGIAERAFELALAHARTRVQFGKTIASFQMVQDKLAQMYVRLESMRVFNYQTLRAIDAIGHHGDAGRGEIHKLSAASVMFTSQMLAAILDDAVQIHGGAGYIWESEINRLFRSIKLLEIAAGTTEVRKLIIAGELVKG